MFYYTDGICRLLELKRVVFVYVVCERIVSVNHREISVGLESVTVLATRHQVETQQSVERHYALAIFVSHVIDLKYRIEPFDERLWEIVVDSQVLGERAPCVLLRNFQIYLFLKIRHSCSFVNKIICFSIF